MNKSEVQGKQGCGKHGTWMTRIKKIEVFIGFRGN